MKLVSTRFNSGGLHEKHVVATWSLGNHLSICLQTQGNQEKPMSRWPFAGPPEYWLLASSPASKVKTEIIIIIIIIIIIMKQCFSLHPDTTPPQPNHNVTPTHIEPEQYNPWNNSTKSRKLLRMDVLTSETCWAVNNEIIKQVTSSWSILIQLCVSFTTVLSSNACHRVCRQTDFLCNKLPCSVQW